MTNTTTATQTMSPTATVIKIAANPPKWVAFPELWLDLVLQGRHLTYGAAVANYRHHQLKHGILIEQPKVAH